MSMHEVSVLDHICPNRWSVSHLPRRRRKLAVLWYLRRHQNSPLRFPVERRRREERNWFVGKMEHVGGTCRRREKSGRRDTGLISLLHRRGLSAMRIS